MNYFRCWTVFSKLYLAFIVFWHVSASSLKRNWSSNQLTLLRCLVSNSESKFMVTSKWNKVLVRRAATAKLQQQTHLQFDIFKQSARCFCCTQRTLVCVSWPHSDAPSHRLHNFLFFFPDFEFLQKFSRKCQHTYFLIISVQ